MADLHYPRHMTTPVEQVLRQMCFEFIREAELWRKTGTPVPKSAEAEQAFFLHLCLTLALEHGLAWRAEFAKLVSERIDHARAGTLVEIR
jgi:hypothetical protein